MTEFNEPNDFDSEKLTDLLALLKNLDKYLKFYVEVLHHRTGRDDKAIENTQKWIDARFVSKNE